jgi:hypothetical protein
MKSVNNDNPIVNFIGGLVLIIFALLFWLAPVALLAFLIAFFLKSCL